MKKFFKILLVIGIIIPLALIVVMDEDNHVHAIASGDSYGTCPDCGNPMTVAYVYDATCTEDGYFEYACRNLGCTNSEVYRATISAYGHNWIYRVSSEATCTEQGSQTKICTECGESILETPGPLGHDWNTVTVAATCTKNGVQKKTCNRCGEYQETTLKALGHDWNVEEKEATCEEEGYKKTTCNRCGEYSEEIYEALGHSYPEDWTVVTEATRTTEGLQEKTCERCGNVISEAIPKKSMAPVVAAVIAGIAVVGGMAVAIILKKKPHVAEIAEEEIVKDTFKPDIEDKTIVIVSEDEDFVKTLKADRYLQVNQVEWEELKDGIIDNEPHLVIVELPDEERYNAVLELKKGEEVKDYVFGFTLETRLLNSKKEELEELKDNEEIIGYVDIDDSSYDSLVKLVLPILKPELNSDETLGNLGKIADLLGIPGVSTIIDYYVTGRDIKVTLEESELGVSESATIIGDLASIMGFDTVASVAGLVDDVDSIKSSLDEEAGANEINYGVEGAKDIVDVVTDLLDK